MNVVYNPSNNDYIRTNTLVKNSIVKIDSLPFKNFIIKHYFGVQDEEEIKKFKLNFQEWSSSDPIDKQKKQDKQTKFLKRRKNNKIDPKFTEELMKGNFLACINSRPGQSGRADGYLLEGKELDFYLKKIEDRKSVV